MKLVNITKKIGSTGKYLIRHPTQTILALVGMGVVYYGLSTGFIPVYIEKYDDRRPIDKINQIVLSNAATNQSLIFGENHARDDDTKYLISLLPNLNLLGYKYLALEYPTDPNPLDGKIDDVVRYLHDYKAGKSPDYKSYRLVFKTESELIRAAVDIGFDVIPIDRHSKNMYYVDSDETLTRDKAMFDTLKSQVFDKEPYAKVVTFVGVSHAQEKPDESNEVPFRLGYLLDLYTDGKSYSIALRAKMPYPPRCDIPSEFFDIDLSEHPLNNRFASYFGWEIRIEL